MNNWLADNIEMIIGFIYGAIFITFVVVFPMAMKMDTLKAEGVVEGEARQSIKSHEAQAGIWRMAMTYCRWTEERR